jgi:hypothetical protein
LQQSCKHIGPAAVGVQLGGIAHPTDSAEEIGQILLQRGLAATENHRLELVAPLVQEGQDSLFIQQWAITLRVHQFGIVAIGAAEIAALGEDHRRHLSGIVDQREGVEATDPHGGSRKVFLFLNSACLPGFQ